MTKILKIRTQVFCLEPEILNCYAIEYGVNCTDAKNAPWDVEFTGPENGLREMLKEHWLLDPAEVDRLFETGVEV